MTVILGSISFLASTCALLWKGPSTGASAFQPQRQSPTLFNRNLRTLRCVSESTDDKLYRIKTLETQNLPDVYLWSDLHVDYQANRQLISRLPHDQYANACLMLPGDLSDDPTLVKESLLTLKSVFNEVIFVPGNHDVWVSKHQSWPGQNSLEKFHDILALCDDLDVCTYPVHYRTKEGGLTLIPLFSWYLSNKDTIGSLYQERNFTDHPAASWADYKKCEWPEGFSEEAVDRYFRTLNKPILKRIETIDVPSPHPHHKISMSHFLPDSRLLFSKSMRTKSDVQKVALDVKPRIPFNFSRVAGTSHLMGDVEAALKEDPVNSGSYKAHCYGHQHRNRCKKINDIRFFNAALGQIREQKKGITQRSPVKVFPNTVNKKYLYMAAYDRDPERFEPYVREMNNKNDKGT